MQTTTTRSRDKRRYMKLRLHIRFVHSRHLLSIKSYSYHIPRSLLQHSLSTPLSLLSSPSPPNLFKTSTLPLLCLFPNPNLFRPYHRQICTGHQPHRRVYARTQGQIGVEPDHLGVCCRRGQVRSGHQPRRRVYSRFQINSEPHNNRFCSRHHQIRSGH